MYNLLNDGYQRGPCRPPKSGTTILIAKKVKKKKNLKQPRGNNSKFIEANLSKKQKFTPSLNSIKKLYPINLEQKKKICQ